MSNINWAKNMLLKKYPSIIDNNGTNLDKSDKIENNVRLQDINSNGVTGDNEDFLDYLNRNEGVLKTEIKFLSYGQGLSLNNRFHQLLYMESVLPIFTEKDTEKAYKKLTNLINVIKKEFNLRQNQNLSIVEKIQLAYTTINNEGYIFNAQNDATFTDNILKDQLDCDTSSFVILTLADELKSHDKEWAEVALINLRGHAFIEINGIYVDHGYIRDKSFYIKHFNLPPNKIDNFFIPLKEEKILANFYFNRGASNSHSGDYRQAINDYTEAIRINPNDDFAYYNRGASNSNLGNDNQAIQDYKKWFTFYDNNEVVQGLRHIKNYFISQATDNKYISVDKLLNGKGEISDSADIIIRAIQQNKDIFYMLQKIEKEGDFDDFVKWGLAPDAISHKDLFSMSRGYSAEGNGLYLKITEIINMIEQTIAE